MMHTCCECKEFVECETIETKSFRGKRKKRYICLACYRKLCRGGKHD